MLSARKKFVLFCDADLATPIEELNKLISYKDDYDIIIGSRKMKNSLVLQRQPVLRRFFGKGFTILSNIILGMNISDFMCGFKMFKKEIVPVIFGLQTLKKWSFDSEILFIAKKHKYRIKEVPIRWVDKRGSKVRILRDVFNSFIELFTIWVNSLRGEYSKVKLCRKENTFSW